METIALLFVYFLYAYFGIGLLFAIFFLWKGGLEEIDEGVKGSQRSFRFLMLPGITAFWPLMLQKWQKSSK